MSPMALYLAFSVGLYIIGLYYMIVKRNMIKLLFAIEVMMNAVNLTFISVSSSAGVDMIHPLSNSLVLLSIGIEACLLAVGLAIIYKAFKKFGTLDIRKLSRLKG
jgi:NADH:ubiquinone oxidoreductase subunit K